LLRLTCRTLKGNVFRGWPHRIDQVLPARNRDEQHG
jgi:hypothetical protein